MRVALIGYSGYWGVQLERVLLAGGHEIIDRYDTQNHQTLEDTDADVAVIATPPETHYHLAMRCMRIGLDVLVEKPMTCKASQAKEMAEYAHKNGIVLGVDSTFVHTAAFKFLNDNPRPLISYQSLRLSVPMPQAKINAGWDLICHDFSILEALGWINEKTQGDGMEDGSVAAAALTLPTGGSAFIYASRAWPTKVREIVLHYPGAVYRWDLKGLWLDGECVASEEAEPLSTMIEEFAYRCNNRLIAGKTDGTHGAKVTRCLERLFPQHSSLGIGQSGVGNGVQRGQAGKYLSV